MAKFNIGINGVGAGVAESREAWAGEIPPTGSYNGVLKILSTAKCGPEAKNAGADKLMVGVELRSSGEKGDPLKKYDGFIAWGQLVLVESSVPYINQFLLALTDGDEEGAEYDAISKAFYGPGPNVDERKKHVLSIGKYKVNSPDGDLPIKVSLRNAPYTNPKTNVTVESVSINSYLLGGGSSAGSVGAPETAVEEESSVDLEPEEPEIEVDIDGEADVEPDVEEPEVEVSADDEALLD